MPEAELLFDEGDYSLWYKPYGMLCQGSKWGDHATINRYAELNLKPQRPAFIVHRLDRAASGLVLLAHSKKAAAALANMFERRLVEKYYQVIVEGQCPQQQTIDTPIDGKNAVSHAQLLKYDESTNRSLVKVVIETGRKHQIRRHMASIGFPIVGDRLHGQALEGEIDLQLTSCFLKFECPISNTIKVFELPQKYRPPL